MMSNRSFTSRLQHVTGIRTTMRNALIAVAVGLTCLALVAALGNVMGEPTDGALAAAVATGG